MSTDQENDIYARGSSGTVENYTALQWSEQTPTEPGWYFRKHIDPDGWEATEICKVRKNSDGTLLTASSQVEMEVEMIDYSLWAGPISEPATQGRNGQAEGDRHEGDDVAALPKEARGHLEPADSDERAEIERWAHLRAEDREYGINLYAIIADIEAKGWLWEASLEPGGTFYEAIIWTNEREYIVREQDTAAVALQGAFEKALAEEKPSAA